MEKSIYEGFRSRLGGLKLIAFDMDGVLVDVRASYIRAIKETVEHFCNRVISYLDIEGLKCEGGYNDDWDLSCELIRRNGISAERRDVVEYFQGLYWGRGGDGFIRHELWLLGSSLIDFLRGRGYILVIFTGRPRREAVYTLKLNGVFDYFRYIVAMEDVVRGKPDPEGLNMILSRYSLLGSEVLYVGDTVDDIISARRAGVYSFGIGGDEGIFVGEGALGILGSLDDLVYIL